MSYYLILCRSVTYAQRTVTALERSGVAAYMLRAPRSISGEGCSHCVKINQRDLKQALEILQRNRLTPKHVFSALAGGGYEEIAI